AAHYIGFNMWDKPVKAAGTTDTDKVIDTMVGITVPNLTGGLATLLPNYRIPKHRLLSGHQYQGQALTVSRAHERVPGDDWSDYLDGSKDLIADWTAPLRCGNYNKVTQACLGASAE